MRTISLFLLCAAIFALLTWAIPEPRNCWIPPNAPTRGIYADCWKAGELWA